MHDTCGTSAAGAKGGTKGREENGTREGREREIRRKGGGGGEAEFISRRARTPRAVRSSMARLCTLHGEVAPQWRARGDGDSKKSSQQIFSNNAAKSDSGGFREIFLDLHD